ncbi:16S rRNA processing protein RimM [Heliorestis acidaminivorans]|uniref:Ribosome maturation factor RimM n=1 Tax=Heliorestis acidaminivorans TaxID=553427 RepID=A0A6I0F3U2_9FIRM|nr:ribosome maturation factor RimM [Heliorestis acidaminivorans]KAB2954430.1 16S rRNA processing protein RimM [Heliorestis acidaminivorans]
MRKHVRVGQVVNTQGIKGQVRVWPLTGSVERFKTINNVYLEKTIPGLPEKLTITATGQLKKLVILSFQEITTMNEAEKLKDSYLIIPIEEVPPREEDSYYHFELEGLKILTEEGELLGQLHEIIETGSNDVYVVRKEDKSQKDLLIPALKSVVLKVDLQEGTMVVKLPEGLLE